MIGTFQQIKSGGALYGYLSIEGQGGSGTDSGGKMKMGGTTYWEEENCGNANCNSSGFNALGSGQHTAGNYFDLQKEIADWWTTSYGSEMFFSYTGTPQKTNGFSVRCIKN